MKLSNIMVSSTLAILAQEREKLQAKENRSIARRAFRLLALFPHFILIADGRRKGFMLKEKNGSLGIPSERHPI